jgi:hypothetical protein
MDLELLGRLTKLSHILEGLALNYYVLPTVVAGSEDPEQYQVEFIDKNPVFEGKVTGRLFFNHNGRVVAKFSKLATPGQMTYIVGLLPEINDQMSREIKVDAL